MDQKGSSEHSSRNRGKYESKSRLVHLEKMDRSHFELLICDDWVDCFLNHCYYVAHGTLHAIMCGNYLLNALAEFIDTI